MTKRSEVFMNRLIVFDEIYYLTYAGGKRELTGKEQSNWNKTLLLPPQLAIKEQKKLGSANNPGVVPISGIKLMEFIKDKGLVPVFDTFFETSHFLSLTNIIEYEYIRSHSKTNLDRG